jgi:small subunit ribosomal protein S24e
MVGNSKNRYGTHRTTCRVLIYKSFDELRKVEMDHIVAKMADYVGVKNIVPEKVPRRVRKKNRKDAYKTFGGSRRNQKKAERKNKSN